MIGRRRSMTMGIAAAALAGMLGAQEPAAGTAATAPGVVRTEAPAAARRWTDPDGKPLPFGSEEELIAFLGTADVKSEKRLSTGINFPTKLLLEKDGIRAAAVFRDVDVQKSTPTFGAGRNELYFRDSYIYEPAAYQLSLLLGLDNVPPATLRKLHAQSGSVQIWVDGAMTQGAMAKDGIEAPDQARWNMQLQMINVFDALVCNTDRNSGNLLVTPDWKLWMIDHTRAFRRNPSLQNPQAIKQCERGMYERLKALDEEVVRERLKPYLSSFELDALLKRRKLILERIDMLIAERGEDKVLYTYTAEAAP